jgi:CTP synthase (UTP-ammonia lyase)
MKPNIQIGLIGDYDSSVPAHQAIPIALQLAADALSLDITPTWLPTDEINSPGQLSRFDGLWCVPHSPYRSMDGALLGIRYAREQGIPFLGTCGGFQHAVIEYARNVLGWANAEHAESSPEAARPVITPLECGLVEGPGLVRFRAGSRIAAAYACDEATEGYLCRYGLNPDFREALLSGPLHIGAEDAEGDVRAVELDGHPFFLATLFQPERAALKGQLPPLATEFVRACAG